MIRPLQMAIQSGQFRPMRNAEVRILPPQPASPVSTRQTGKTAQNHAVRRVWRIWLGLRVGIWAAKASFRRLVSEATFWCLIPASHGEPIGTARFVHAGGRNHYAHERTARPYRAQPCLTVLKDHARPKINV